VGPYSSLNFGDREYITKPTFVVSQVALCLADLLQCPTFIVANAHFRSRVATPNSIRIRPLLRKTNAEQLGFATVAQPFWQPVPQNSEVVPQKLSHQMLLKSVNLPILRAANIQRAGSLVGRSVHAALSLSITRTYTVWRRTVTRAEATETIGIATS
jgi:hypothetical protein